MDKKTNIHSSEPLATTNHVLVTETRPMLVNLHLLRFLAAIAVLATHMAEHVWASGLVREGWLYAVYLVGYGGVDVFFVISGFIIWHTTREENGFSSASQFLRRRVARTFSGYWPFLLLAVFLIYRYQPDLLAAKNWWLSTTFIPNPLATTEVILPERFALPVAWTLLYEVYFYLAFCLYIAFRQQASLGIVVWAIVILVVATCYGSWNGVFSVEKFLDSSLVYSLYLSPYCLEFLAGCLIGEFFRKRKIRWPILWLGIGLTVTVFTGWINSKWFDGALNMGYYMQIRVLLLTTASVGFVLWALWLDQEGKRIWPRLCIALGGGTYALYLSHTLWLKYLLLSGINNWFQQHNLIVVGYWLASVFIILISTLYYLWGERRLHHGFRKLLGVVGKTSKS